MLTNRSGRPLRSWNRYPLRVVEGVGEERVFSTIWKLKQKMHVCLKESRSYW